MLNPSIWTLRSLPLRNYLVVQGLKVSDNRGLWGSTNGAFGGLKKRWVRNFNSGRLWILDIFKLQPETIRKLPKLRKK